MAIKRPSDSGPRRDRYDRPIIVQPDGTEASYERPSKLGGILMDESAIQKWRERNILKGIAVRPQTGGPLVTPGSSPFVQQIREVGDDKFALELLAEEAFEAGGGTESSTWGTRLHKITERLDSDPDYEPSNLETELVDDLNAYREITEGAQYYAVEPFMVNDEWKVAGSPDRILTSGAISDLKTSKNVKLAAVEYAVQLACYAHSVLYDNRTGERLPTMALNKDYAYIVWVPKGTGTAKLYQVDLRFGAAAAKLALDVLEVRKGTGILTQAASTESDRRASKEAYWIGELLFRHHDTVESVRDVWRRCQDKGELTETITNTAKTISERFGS